MSEYSYRGRTVTKDQYEKLVQRSSRGECPFCDRTGLRDNFNSKGKHIRSCIKRVGWDKTDQGFPMWQIGLAEYPIGGAYENQ